VISEALAERDRIECLSQRDAQRAVQKQRDSEKPCDSSELDARIQDLPLKVRDGLREAAIYRLTQDGIKSDFLLESLIKIEMLRMIGNQGS
jgi:hypothetical protein